MRGDGTITDLANYRFDGDADGRAGGHFVARLNPLISMNSPRERLAAAIDELLESHLGNLR